MRRRHLTADERAAIAEARAQGVQVQELARHWGVSRQTIHATLKAVSAGGVEGGQIAAARRSPTLSTRVSDKDLQRLDEVAALWGMSRPEALRRLVREVEAILAPVGPAPAGLVSVAVAVHEAGRRINEIAKACNEAARWGQPLPYTVQHQAQIRQARTLVLEVAGQVQALAGTRRAQIDVATATAFAPEGATKDKP